MCCVYPVILAAVMALLQAPRDKPAAPPERGTAVLGGRVTDKDSGLPLTGVNVELRLNAREARSTQTGGDGRYRFADVPPGSYVLAADGGENRATHIPQIYGDASSYHAVYGLSRKPILLEVRAGETRDDLHIAMTPALAITGTVVNEAGEPMANVLVQARPIIRGRTLSGGPLRSTDDRGAFRIFGLPPGRYHVCTQPATHLSSVPARRPDRLVATCYPSAIRQDDAAVVALSSGDAPDVQIRVQRMRTVRMAGTVLDSTGAPAPRATVNVEARDRLERFSASVTVHNGQFAVEGLLPGEYRLLAYASGPDDADLHAGQLGSATVTVDSDTDAVVLPMTKAASVAGHVVFENAPAPPMTERPTVRAVLAAGGVSPKPASVRDDMTFELQGLFGPQLLDVANLPTGWTLKAVRYSGADVTDVPVTFGSSRDPRVLQISLTDRAPVVSGRVEDDKGQPLGDARIFLFPADPERRRRGVSGDAQAGDDGAFSLGRQRAGDYLIVAVHDDDVRFDERPDVDLLAKVADRVTLHEGAQVTLTLRLAKIPGER